MFFSSSNYQLFCLLMSISLDTWFPSLFGRSYITSTIHFEAKIVPDLANGCSFYVTSLSFDIYLYLNLHLFVSISAERPRYTHMYKLTLVIFFLCLSMFKINIYISVIWSASLWVANCLPHSVDSTLTLPGCDTWSGHHCPYAWPLWSCWSCLGPT